MLKQILRDAFTTKDALSEPDTRLGLRMVVVDGVCSTAMLTLQGGVFLAAFALALGASNYEIGLLVTIAFLSQLMQLPGLWLLTRFRKRKLLTAICAGAARLLWVFIIFIPVLFVDRGMTFMLQWLIVASLVGALPGPAWNSLLRDVIPAERMGRVFSKRISLGTALALTLTLAGGHFVTWWQETYPAHPLYGYSLIFAAGMVFGLLGAAAILRIPEPTMAIEGNSDIWSLLATAFKDRNFRLLLYFIAFWNFAVNMAGPFFVIYMLKRIEISFFLVTVLVVVSQVTNLIFLRVWGKLADRFSNKSVMSVSGLLVVLSMLAWCFTTMPERHVFTYPLLVLIHVISGMATAGTVIASLNIALKLSPREQTHGYMTVFGITGAVAGAVGPLAGGVLADFFSARSLDLAINWADPARKLSIYAINLKALDFLFLIAFMVGLYALYRLALVREEGEVENKRVMSELIAEMKSPFRAVSSAAGVRRLALIPVSALLGLLQIGVSGTRNRADTEQGGEVNE